MTKLQEYIKRIVALLLGSFLVAISINAFIIPHKFLSGGVAGVAIIVEYIANIPSGYLILLLNIPIFLIGMKEVDRDFTIFSFLGMIAMSGFLICTKPLGNMLMVNDKLLSSIYSGVIGGIGIGIIFRNRASMGGTDIIAVVLKKKFGVNISTLSFIMNAIVVLIGVFINTIEIALYTLISMYITSIVMERVIDGLDRKKLLFIVTEKEEEVSNAIMEKISRGVTYLYGEGAYTGDRKKILYCIVTLNQTMRTKKIIEDIDPGAFISILDAAEVHGKGFKGPAL